MNNSSEKNATENIPTVGNNDVTSEEEDKHNKSIENTSEDANNEIKFKDLSYIDVQINLRLLSDIKEGEKIMILDGRFMQVDNRYAQSFRRYISSDSRLRTLNFIEHVIIWAKKYCGDAVEKIYSNVDRKYNLEMLISLQSLLKSSLTGLSRISTTYANDKHNLATIETFKSTIVTFCDQDLKKAIGNE
jgi:hypothetical protein